MYLWKPTDQTAALRPTPHMSPSFPKVADTIQVVGLSGFGCPSTKPFTAVRFSATARTARRTIPLHRSALLWSLPQNTLQEPYSGRYSRQSSQKRETLLWQETLQRSSVCGTTTPVVAGSLLIRLLRKCVIGDNHRRVFVVLLARRKLFIAVNGDFFDLVLVIEQANLEVLVLLVVMFVKPACSNFFWASS